MKNREGMGQLHLIGVSDWEVMHLCTIFLTRGIDYIFGC